METTSTFVVTVNSSGCAMSLEANSNESILTLLRHNDIYIDAPCNGVGKCGKCKAVISGIVSPLTPAEQQLLTDEDIRSGIRLVCMCYPHGDCTVTLEQAEFGVQLDGMAAAYELSPWINSGVGMAVDIGTTTLACYFLDLSSGSKLYTASGINHQRTFGADVISRITVYIDSADGARLLQEAIVEQLNGFIADFCSISGHSNTDIKTIAIAGNTVMLHLLTRENAIGIATAPFACSSLFGYEVTADSLGINADASVYLADCVASYVGGDITAGIVATGVHLHEKPCLYIDIGTNGEMAIGDRNGFVCCATAAGPAFEGAHIKCGVGGVQGAINGIIINGDDFSVTTIGDKTPVGICGSGLISVIAALLQLGVIDETGRIDADEISESLQYRYYEDDQPAFFLDKEHEIMLTQRDVREVQLAKAAIAAGISTLMHAKGVDYNDIDRVILAGGFGSYIDKASACAIGLLPQELIDRITVVGNAAGMGAIRLVLDGKAMDTLNETTKSCEYYELSGDSYFQDEYVAHMCFE